MKQHYANDTFLYCEYKYQRVHFSTPKTMELIASSFFFRD